jgi:hypothetical protein
LSPLWEGYKCSVLFHNEPFNSFTMFSSFPFSLADMVSFYLSEHLENSEKLTEASGCCFLYSSQQICTNTAYDDILPLAS